MTEELDFRDVMEVVDYHVKACLDRAAGEPLDTASTRAKVAQAISAWKLNAQPYPAGALADGLTEYERVRDRNLDEADELLLQPSTPSAKEQPT